MRRPLAVLLCRLVGKRSISLHDPPRDLGVSLERRILQENPALFPRQCRRVTRGIIIVVGGKGCLRTESADVRQTLGRAAARHEHLREQAEQLRCPCHTAPMVAVRRSDEREPAQTRTHLRLLQAFVGHLLLRETEILHEIPCRRIARTEPLERVQSEPLALVLDRDASEPQALREMPQLTERCRGIGGYTLMKSAGTRRHRCVVCRYIGQSVYIVLTMDCLDRFVHDDSLPCISYAKIFSTLYHTGISLVSRGDLFIFLFF